MNGWKLTSLAVLFAMIGMAFFLYAASLYLMRPAAAQPQTPPPGATGAGNQTPDPVQQRLTALEAKVQAQQGLIQQFQDQGDRFDALNAILAATSLGLVLVSLVFGVLGAVGWNSLKEIIERRVREELAARSAESKKEFGRLRQELEGRTHSALGLVFGRLAREEGNFLKVKRHDLLDLAIENSKKAYDLLEEIESDYRWRPMNNLAYYYAMSEKSSWRKEALLLAKRLKRRFSETRDNLHFVTTYIRVVGEFPSLKNPEATFQRALRDVENLLQDRGLSDRDRKEAEIYRGWLRGKLQALGNAS